MYTKRLFNLPFAALLLVIAACFVSYGISDSTTVIYGQSVLSIGDGKYTKLPSAGIYTYYEGIWPSISADGNLVAVWTSEALISSDANFISDVYMWNKSTGEMKGVSYEDGELGGGDNPYLTPNGKFIFYSRDGLVMSYDVALDTSDVFMAEDGRTFSTSLLSASANGRYIIVGDPPALFDLTDRTYIDVEDPIRDKIEDSWGTFSFSEYRGDYIHYVYASIGDLMYYPETGETQVFGSGNHYAHMDTLITIASNGESILFRSGGDDGDCSDFYVWKMKSQTYQCLDIPLLNDMPWDERVGYVFLGGNNRYLLIYEHIGDTTKTSIYDMEMDKTTVLREGTYDVGYSSAQNANVFLFSTNELIGPDNNGWVDLYMYEFDDSSTSQPTPTPIPGQDKTVLVYVHGWQGMSDIGSSCSTGALKYDPSSANLPDPGNVPLLAWLYEDGWDDVYSLHWNTSSEHSDSIKDAGACIAGQIETLKEQYPTDTQFVLLTHSMGGPNTRWYLESGNWPNAADQVKSLIMLGAPNMGLLERTSTVCKGLSILSHQIAIPDDACNLNQQVDFFELRNDELDGIAGILDGTGKPQDVDYFVINGDSDSLVSQIAKWSIAGDGEYPMDFLVPAVSGIKLPNTKRFITMEDHSEIPGGSTIGIRPYYGIDVSDDRTDSYHIVTDILDGGSYTEASESAMTRAQDVIDSDSFEKEYPSHDILNANVAPLDSYVFKENLAYGKGLIVVSTGDHEADLFVTMPDGTFFDPLQVSHEGVTAMEGENYIAVRISRLQSPGDWQFSLLNNDSVTQNYPIAIWYGNPVFADASIPESDLVVGKTVELLFGLGLQSDQLQAASVSTETITSVVVTIMAPDGTDMIFNTQSVNFTPMQTGIYVIDYEVNSINQSGDSVRRIDSRVIRVLEAQSTEETLYMPIIAR